MKFISRFFAPRQKTLEETAVIGAEAKQLLDNKHLQDAFDSVRLDVQRVAMGCDPDDKDKSQRVVISMQLLESIIREIERKIADGEVAKMQLAEAAKANRKREMRR